MKEFDKPAALARVLESKGFRVSISRAYVEGVQGSATVCFGDVCTTNARVVYLQRSTNHRGSTPCADKAVCLRLNREYRLLSSVLTRMISTASPRAILLCGSNDKLNAALLQVLWAVNAGGLTPSCVVALEDFTCKLAERLGLPVIELRHVEWQVQLTVVHAAKEGKTNRACVYIYPSWHVEKLNFENLEPKTCSEIIIVIAEGYPSLRGIGSFLTSKLRSRTLFIVHGEPVGLYKPDRLLVVWGVKDPAIGRRWSLLAASSAIIAARFHNDPKLRSSLYRAVRCADKWLREGDAACSGLLPRLLYGSWLAISTRTTEVRLAPLPTALYLLGKGSYILYNIDSGIAVSSREAMTTLLDAATHEAMNLGCC